MSGSSEDEADGGKVDAAEVTAVRLAMVRQAINGSMAESDRSQFAKDRLGVSDIGHCREYARRVIIGAPREGTQQNYLPAFVGTAVGDRIENEIKKAWPNARTQVDVTVHLVVQDFALNIPGHPDLVLEDGVVDFKTQDGLGVARNSGATLQQKFQVTLYASGLIAAGVLTEDCWLSLVFIDRSGKEPDPHIETWQYDPAIQAEAEEWLGDVIYAVVNNETASKDMPRSWCEACCDFAPSCRGGDTDVEGLITDPLILDAVRVYRAALDAEKAAKKDKDSAVSILRDVRGSTGEYSIRWTSVPPSSVNYERAGYERLTLSPIRKKGK